MLKYKILIKLFVLICMLICCIYCDTIKAEVVSPYIQKTFWVGFKQVIVM